MQPARYFTKSHYRTALECPTKLYYGSRPGEYPSRGAGDPFLVALQDGGFQVGALARLYHPGGVLVSPLRISNALEETARHMQKRTVVLFEAAFESDGLLVRTDILVKEDNRITIKEVKSRSFHPLEDSLITKKGEVAGKWEADVRDVAFQTYVLRKAVPGSNVTARLVLCDKSRAATVDGVNQLFRVLRSEGGPPEVRPARPDITLGETGDRLLYEVEVTEIVDRLLASPEFEAQLGEFTVGFFSERRPEVTISRACRRCEYRVPSATVGAGEKSGFDECWRLAGLNEEEAGEPHILDIGNLYFKTADDLLARRKYLMRHIDPEADLTGSAAPRQRLQVRTALDANHPAEHVDPDLFRAMEGFALPLHFIDFETATVALPSFAGQRPYELVAFQFSCHVMHADGRVEHAAQWIQAEPGRMPNVDFVRALRRVLGEEGGTILRYSYHENTVLNGICDLLRSVDDEEVPDRMELMAWIRTITQWKEGKEAFAGERCMVDQWELVKRYYYHREMRGSNGIKHVLPAVLGQSEALRECYSAPYYGTNFPDGQVWWQLDEETGRVKNPYALLPRMEGLAEHEDDAIANGGAAATAYAKMQFTGMGEHERNELRKNLLRYCELDTLAMVMIYQHWSSLRSRNLQTG